MPPPPLSAETAAAVAPLVETYNRRELRVLLFLARTPGEWTQAGLASVLLQSQPNLSAPLQNLTRDGLLTVRKQPGLQGGPPVRLYKLAA